MKPENYRKSLTTTRDQKWLLKKAIHYFNAFIRERDKDKGCISCSCRSISDAGHWQKAGRYQSLRFDEMNVHGQCKSCNYYQGGRQSETRLGILNRYGLVVVNKLELKAGMERQMGSYKLDRFTLIEIIMQYKLKMEKRSL